MDKGIRLMLIDEYQWYSLKQKMITDTIEKRRGNLMRVSTHEI